MGSGGERYRQHHPEVARQEPQRDEHHPPPTTLEIARRAEVSERLIFAKFGTKAQLFSAAVVAPFAVVVDEYAEAWADESTHTMTDKHVERLVRHLYALARENRLILLDAIREHASAGSHASLVDGLAASFHRMLRIAGQDRFQSVDWPAALGTVVGMVLGAALLQDVIYPADQDRPGEDRLVREMTSTLLDGYRARLDISYRSSSAGPAHLGEWEVPGRGTRLSRLTR